VDQGVLGFGLGRVDGGLGFRVLLSFTSTRLPSSPTVSRFLIYPAQSFAQVPGSNGLCSSGALQRSGPVGMDARVRRSLWT
jgi:hypothetical protein